jgi:hypothetical protein
MTDARLLTVGGVLTAFSFFSPEVVSADQREPTIVVQVDDYAGIRRADLVDAEMIADRIYQAIGVRVIWVHEEVPPGDPRGLRVHLRLLSRDMAARKIFQERIANDVLGQAVPPSRCAYIFFHRVSAVARQRLTDYARVLGLTMAHEIGHIVLPSAGHSDTGIMNPNVYLRSKYTLVYFTNEQAEAIRALLMKLANNRSSADDVARM